MDRALSFFGAYDVFGYLASGISAVVGVWWVVEGSIPQLSTVAVLGLLGASYLAGQITAILGNLWEEQWWRGRRGKPYVRMLEEDGYEFERPLRLAIKEQIDAEARVPGLKTGQRFSLARAKLRMTGFDSRAETMRALHGLCRNLVASAALIFVTAVTADIVHGGELRLSIAAALSFVSIWAFIWRALKFEHRFGRAVWLGYLALQMSPPASGGSSVERGI
jgi:hypothetical protein